MWFTIEIFDTTRVEAIDVTAGDIQRLSDVAEQFSSRGNPVKGAIVASADLPFELARMYEMLQSQAINQLKVFRERADAEA